MATQPTNLPVPSESPRDLKFNTGKIDEFVTSSGWTYTDRFGNKHYTIEGLRWIAQQAIASYGYITMDSFEEGNTLTLPNQVLRLEANGEYYRWDGAFPKSVPENSTPESTGGIGAGAWLSVGDATLRGQISDPDGATLYPELQLARWRDDGDARGWGVFPDGTDVTARMCAWLDAVNGDYSKLVQYGQGRFSGYLPSGEYKVNMANLIGNHKLLGRFIIRGSLTWDGYVPDGDFTVLHTRSINLNGIVCKTLIFQGVQWVNVENTYCTGDCTLKGSISDVGIPGLVTWGGGSYWNNFNATKVGVGPGPSALYLNAYEGSVNQNTFTQTTAALKLIGGGPSPIGGGDMIIDSNSFFGLDTSNSTGYWLDNSSIKPLMNYVYGLYTEGAGNQKIKGDTWLIDGMRCNFQGWLSQVPPSMTILGVDPNGDSYGGNTISVSATNLCPSGDWSVLNGKGVPEDYNLLTIPNEVVSFADPNEPGGCGRMFGVSNASVRCRIVVNLTKSPTGFIRGAFYFRGDTPVELVIEDANNPDAVGTTIYYPVDKFYDMGVGSWKLYRVAYKTPDKSKTYRLRITVGAGKPALLGCSTFSNYTVAVMPTFAGWGKTIVRSPATPNFLEPSLIPLGLRAVRNYAAAVPSDPIIGWQWNGSSWLKMVASA